MLIHRYVQKCKT